MKLRSPVNQIHACVGLELIGLATMWGAVFADIGVALAAIFNATRVMK